MLISKIDHWFTDVDFLWDMIEILSPKQKTDHISVTRIKHLDTTLWRLTIHSKDSDKLHLYSILNPLIG